MVEVITLGEILVEIMRPAAGQPLDQPGEFRGPFASGAPAIFAVAAARLELNTAFIGAVGEDAFGRLLERRLNSEGIEIAGLQTRRGYATGAAFVAYEADGSREFVFHIRHAAAGSIDAEAIPRGLFDNINWLHLSGSSLFLNKSSLVACQQALELTQAAGGKISLDPNLRLELMALPQSRQVLEPFIQAANLFLPTESEVQLLTGETKAKVAVEKLAHDPSSRITVLKRAADGCSIFTGGKWLDVPGFSVEEVDPTGAGDCFSAAFIAGLQAGWALEEVGRFANAAGALAVSRLGPMEGAPTFQQIQGLINAQSGLQD